MNHEMPMVLEREAGAPEHIPQVGVGFCMDAMKDDAKSDAAGREIFVDVEFVKIQVPGDKFSMVYQPANDVHRKRFPKAYAMFKQQTSVSTEGTRIEHWPAIGRAMALNLKAAGVHTVEALAEVHDGNLDKLGYGVRELRAQARGFIALAKDAAVAQKLEGEKQQLLDLIGNLQDQIRDLAKHQGVDVTPAALRPGKQNAPAPKPKKPAAKPKRKAA